MECFPAAVAATLAAGKKMARHSGEWRAVAGLAGFTPAQFSQNEK
jgi:hypothetical protein